MRRTMGEQRSRSAEGQNEFLNTQSGEKQKALGALVQSTIIQEWLQKGRMKELAKRASQEVEQKVNFGDDVVSTDESVCDVGVCDLREKTNTNNRCEKTWGWGKDTRF